MSAPGSSSTVTARCTPPSTSCRTASTSAVRPWTKRSWASVRRSPGRSRTRLPGPTEAPSIVIRSRAGSAVSARAGSHQGVSGRNTTSSEGSSAMSGGCSGPVTSRRARTAPCSRSSTSGGIDSARSITAAARASVPRASRFSCSVRAAVRRARISSISVASYMAPTLSGAMAGWSSRMIGEDRTTSARPGSPASTGQVCRFSQAATACLAHSGGSVIERKDPASRPSSRWAATSECGRAASRSTGPAPGGGVHGLVFSTTARSLSTR